MGSTKTIAVIPQGSTHQHWKAVHAGALKAQRELLEQGVNVTIIWKGPHREDDRAEQLKIVEGFIRQGVHGIVLAPFDSRALVPAVEQAAQSGIPTVVIDSALETPHILSFIATDNRKGGALAADRMGDLLRGQGKVLVLRYQKGVNSTEAREEGFVERLRSAYPGTRAVHSDEYAGATRDTARRASESLLARHGQDARGVFTPNESSTAGMLLALQGMQKAEKIVLIGFDASAIYLDAMRYKRIQGLVVQDPFRMGELGVKTLADHFQGKQVQKRIDTGAMMVTPENMDAPGVQRLLHPPAEP